MKVALLATLLVGQIGPAGNSIFGPQVTPFVAPNQLFSVQIPPGWLPYVQEKEPNAVEFRPTHIQGDGSLFIRRIQVPSNANPRQLALNGVEQRLKKLPNFKLAEKRSVKVGGNPAATVTGSYSFQGNLQYPRAVEEVYVIVGGEAFVFHFECFEPAAGLYVQDLSGFYSTFIPRPVGAGGPFAVPDTGESFPVPTPQEIPY